MSVYCLLSSEICPEPAITYSAHFNHGTVENGEFRIDHVRKMLCRYVDTEDWPVGDWARHDEVRIFE